MKPQLPWYQRHRQKEKERKRKEGKKGRKEEKKEKLETIVSLLKTNGILTYAAEKNFVMSRVKINSSLLRKGGQLHS